MEFKTKIIRKNCINQLAQIPEDTQDVVVISTMFDHVEKERPRRSKLALTNSSSAIIEHCFRILKSGGLAFVYGIPAELWLWSEGLNSTCNVKAKMIFKYWIALDIDNNKRTNYLISTHQGLLMYLKTVARGNTPFTLNTKDVRIPYNFCKACKQNVKDWGGKKHLMNPRGACVSDVWRDLPRVDIKENTIPKSVLKRIIDLATTQSKSRVVHIIQREKAVEERHQLPAYEMKAAIGDWDFRQLEHNSVYLGDCISFLRRVYDIYPGGAFDLVFADPPYNLSKSYNHYSDEVADREYVEWCNSWLYGMYKVLKPGGALFVLNLPKWAIHHAAFLGQYMDFKHWIVWDALSEPRGKIMPSHYALLYYTKAGKPPKFRCSKLHSEPVKGIVLKPDAPYYCLRSKCVRHRKSEWDDDKVELSDIWTDIHRIKHKRDRDAHPCQLPDSLMERIILLTTEPGDVVFDPFAGAGTTAVVAYKLRRKFVVTDIDQKYVQITRGKISEMAKNRDLFGNLVLNRKSVRRQRANGSKREVELYLQELARRLGRVPTYAEIEADQPDIIRKIDTLYPDRNSAVKRCKVALVEL